MKKSSSIFVLLILMTTSLVSLMPIYAGPDDSVIASPPPGDNHFDINFVTTRGYNLFTSTYIGTTTPTVPPLYWKDDFDDGNADGWTTFGTGGSWAIEDDTMSDGLTKVYSQSDRTWTSTSTYDTFWRSYAGDTSWEDYSIEAEVKVVEAGALAPIAGIFFRVQGFTATSDYYLFRIDERQQWGVYLEKSPNVGLIWDNFVVVTGQVYKLKVVVSGSNIKCYVDNVLKLEYNDSTYSNGAIGVGTFNSHTHFDNVLVLGSLGPGQSWVGNGPDYTETRTMSGPLTGPVLSGILDVSSTSTLNAVTGSGTTTGTWTLTDALGGFAGTLTATNTNFGLLSGSFVSTSGSGFYVAQDVSGTFTGYFYESNLGVSGYDRFEATLTGMMTKPNEVLIGPSGSHTINFQWGDSFVVLDDDATVGSALIQLPGGPSMTGWFYEIFDQPRGKPNQGVEWFYVYSRSTSKPVWYAHFGPARGANMNYNFRLHWDTWYPAIYPGWPTTLINNGCTNFATRWYYYDTP